MYAHTLCISQAAVAIPLLGLFCQFVLCFPNRQPQAGVEETDFHS